MRVKDALGRFGEQAAADHLRAAGMQVLASNWRCREGELDIVGQDGQALVFVEVKTRSSVAYGLPAEAVDRRKIARIRRLATLWIEDYRSSGDVPFWSELRFDVVGVVRLRAGGVAVDHVRSAF